MAVTRTPEGFVQIPATISRTGIYEYSAGEMRAQNVPIPDGVPNDAVVRVYRSPDVVAAPDSMKSFENKPVTLGHPAHHAVTPETLRNDIHGISLAPVEVRDEHLHVGIQLMSDEAIAAYSRGMNQLSCGYQAALKLEAGITDSGEPYDARQTRIIGNHIALCNQGRAGSARLLDSEDSMEIKEALAKIAELQTLADSRVVKVEELQKTLDELLGKVKALEASQVTDAQVEERAKALLGKAKAREALIARARLLAPKIEVAEATSDRDIMALALRAQLGDSVTIDGKSDDYVRGIFDNLRTPGEKPGSAAHLGVATDDVLLSHRERKELAWSRGDA